MTGIRFSQLGGARPNSGELGTVMLSRQAA